MIDLSSNCVISINISYLGMGMAINPHDPQKFACLILDEIDHEAKRAVTILTEASYSIQRHRQENRMGNLWFRGIAYRRQNASRINRYG